jgi:hypothetical protein
MGRPKKHSKKTTTRTQTKVIPAPAIPTPAQVVPSVAKPEYVLVYLDTDGQLKLERFRDVQRVSNFIAEVKLDRRFYVLVFGEFLVGPADIESRVPEAFLKDIDDEGLTAPPPGYEDDPLFPRGDDENDEEN